MSSIKLLFKFGTSILCICSMDVVDELSPTRKIPSQLLQNRKLSERRGLPGNALVKKPPRRIAPKGREVSVPGFGPSKRKDYTPVQTIQL